MATLLPNMQAPAFNRRTERLYPFLPKFPNSSMNSLTSLTVAGGYGHSPILFLIYLFTFISLFFIIIIIFFNFLLDKPSAALPDAHGCLPCNATTGRML